MRPCVRRLAVAALAVPLLAVAHPLLAAATTPVSTTELRTTLARLEGAVSSCAAATQSSASACDPASVGDDLRVGDPKQGGYEVHWDWLRTALAKAKAAEPQKRAVLLEDSAAALRRMATELDTPGSTPQQRQELRSAHTDATSILAEPEFQRNVQLTWWDRQKARLWAWLGEIFANIARAGAAAPWLGPALEWTFFVLAAAGLLFFLLRVLARQRLRISLAGAAVASTAWDREATDWATDADAFAAKQEWREAVHCLYWASIVALESRRAWRHNPTRTPREYLRLLKPGSPQQRSLRALTRIFERVWYGLRDARAEEYVEARALYEALTEGSAAAQTSPSDSGNATPFAAGGTA